MDFFQMIANLGFPIALSVYLLIRFEKKIDDMGNKFNILGDRIDESMRSMVKEITDALKDK